MSTLYKILFWGISAIAVELFLTLLIDASLGLYVGFSILIVGLIIINSDEADKHYEELKKRMDRLNE